MNKLAVYKPLFKMFLIPTRRILGNIGIRCHLQLKILIRFYTRIRIIQLNAAISLYQETLLWRPTNPASSTGASIWSRPKASAKRERLATNAKREGPRSHFPRKKERRLGTKQPPICVRCPVSFRSTPNCHPP